MQEKGKEQIPMRALKSLVADGPKINRNAKLMDSPKHYVLYRLLQRGKQRFFKEYIVYVHRAANPFLFSNRCRATITPAL